MTIDWKDLAGRVIGLGAPLLGQALGGPLGGAAGKILADALGAPAAEPATIDAALTQARGDAAIAEAVLRAEAEWAAAVAGVAKAQVSEVAATQRAEMASGDPLQRWWRPVYALELSLLECPAFALTLLHAIWSGHEAGITGLVNLSGLLMAYFAARFGVLGVYVSGRSREKQAACTGLPAPSTAERVVKAIKGR